MLYPICLDGLANKRELGARDLLLTSRKSTCKRDGEHACDKTKDDEDREQFHECHASSHSELVLIMYVHPTIS